MPVYGFIVEGHLESDVIKHLCKNAEVRRLRLNGRDVSIEKICTIIYPHIVFLLRKVDTIYIIVDREQRAIDSKAMEKEVIEGVGRKGIDVERIVVSVPDRCIESWIAPFVDDKCILQRRPCRERGEGVSGKNELRAIFKRNERNYVEVIDGVRYFKAIIPAELAKVSDSFSRLYEKIADGCWWKSRSFQEGVI